MRLPVHGSLTWNATSFTDVLSNRKQNRVIGLSFPAQNSSLGLEPSILTVLPEGDNVEYSPQNKLFNDNDVQLYLCSVYISGMEEFEKWALQHDPNKIVVGGYHPTTFPEEFERYAAKVVQGPCDNIYETIKQPGKIVSGVLSHNKIPRRDLYDMSINQQIIPDKKPEDVVVSINTSMGCHMKCNFCCSPVMANRVVSSPIELVSREVQDLTRFSPKFMFIRDENFTLQKDWQERLQILHAALPDTKIYLFASANTITEKAAAFMKDHGVYMICLGLEDPTKVYTKNNHLDNAVKLLKACGIYVYLSFIVNPLEIIGKQKGEEFYSILTSRFEELAPEMVCGNFLMPFRGTGLWDEYYAFVSRSDYKYYDSKTPFLVRNEVLQEKMKFFMFWYQWKYYTSDFYQKNVRKFDVSDTLHLRFVELKDEFESRYLRYWNVRA